MMKDPLPIVDPMAAWGERVENNRLKIYGIRSTLRDLPMIRRIPLIIRGYL